MEKNLRPAIRFAEFTDDWEQRKLEDTVEFLDTMRKPLEEAKRISGPYPYYGASGIVDYVDGYLFDEELVLLSEDGANITDRNYPVCFLASGQYWVNNHAHVLRTNKNIDNNFLCMTLERKDYKQYNSGMAMPKLNQEVCRAIPVACPEYDEQVKVGDYFRQLDNLITLQQNKYDKFVSVRASMLEKLFIQDGDMFPQIRFREYKVPWKKVRLGEIVVPYSDPVETPHDGYERLGIRSHGKGVFHDYVEAGKEIGTAQMHRVASHNLIVNITFAWEHAVAITDDNDVGKLVSHRFPQFAMTDEIYDQFLKYMILDARFRHHLLLSSPGGAGRNRVLKVSEMLEYEMMIPEVEEQKQIANYLNSLDKLISLYKIRVQKLKNIKMACLQKMFV